MTDASDLVQRRFHEAWLGMVQPVEGLVVSVPVLVDAQCMERQSPAVQERLRALCPPRRTDDSGPSEHTVASTRELLRELLGYGEDTWVEGDALPDELSLYVHEGRQRVRPTMALKSGASQAGASQAGALKTGDANQPWAMLLWELPEGLSLDRAETVTGPWDYPPAAKFDRLLRHAKVPVGVLTNRRAFRLVYAPHGESSGSITFDLDAMVSVGGRPVLDAFVMLLSHHRTLVVEEARSLASILSESRKRQANVTNALAEQVFDALQILLRGFEAAAQRDGSGHIAAALSAEDDYLYKGLLTVLLRLVFVLYAEDRGLLPIEHPLYSEHLSLLALFDRLQRERGEWPDSMSRRYSAWGALVALFRAVFLGVEHETLRMPPRRGELFDPHRFSFIEGWGPEGSAPIAEAWGRAEVRVPTVDDETVYRVLEKLLVFEGQRLSYRALDVEQIGSIYEGLMGYHVQRVEHDSVCTKPLGVWVSREEIEAVPSAQRAKWLKESLGLSTAHSDKLAKDPGLLETHAIKRKDDPGLSRARVGQLVLQPGSERRRTSSHYTPRSLSAPIVKRTLEPLLAVIARDCASEQAGALEQAPAHWARKSAPAALAKLGAEEAASDGRERSIGSPSPSPAEGRPLAPLAPSARELAPAHEPTGLEQTPAHPRVPKSARILALKVCDPAMGSGAFLVEACRYLADEVVAAWTEEGALDAIAREHGDALLHARRLVAQRCLYGVDKNAAAVELAKLSLWLVTLAKDLPFTFVDHALRHGDSLVGLDFDQIRSFHWKPGKQLELFTREVKDALDEAISLRQRILALASSKRPADVKEKEALLWDAEDALNRVRLIGDLVVGAFFAKDKDKDREKERVRRLELVRAWLQKGGAPSDELRELQRELRKRVPALHWAVEFPEVFYAEREDVLDGMKVNGAACMDGFIGNPPFMDKNGISSTMGLGYIQWQQATLDGAHGNSDIVGYFFRRCANLLGSNGCFGLIATNTVAQGDTRTTGLAAITARGGRIYCATSALPWPGDAGVTVSVVHVAMGLVRDRVSAVLDGTAVRAVNSRLRVGAEYGDAVQLLANSCWFQGSKVYGAGFQLTPEERDVVIADDPKSVEVIGPYVGGEELNSDPRQEFNRYVINFGQMTLDRARGWTRAMEIVLERVKPERDTAREDTADGAHRKKYWWQFAQPRPELAEAIRPLTRCLASSNVTKHLVFAFQPTDRVFANTLNIFAMSEMSSFAILQSRTHEPWARLHGSSLEDRLRYTASDCFETFPFPRPDPRTVIPELEEIGEKLYTARAKYMVDENVGLTITYNRLKDPGCTEERIVALRAMHEAMDRAVLRAYGWEDLAQRVPPYCVSGEADKRAMEAFESEVIERLFALNAKRAEEERVLGIGKGEKKGRKPVGSEGVGKGAVNVTQSTPRSSSHLATPAGAEETARGVGSSGADSEWLNILVDSTERTRDMRARELHDAIERSLAVLDSCLVKRESVIRLENERTALSAVTELLGMPLPESVRKLVRDAWGTLRGSGGSPMTTSRESQTEAIIAVRRSLEFVAEVMRPIIRSEVAPDVLFCLPELSTLSQLEQSVRDLQTALSVPLYEATGHTLSVRGVERGSIWLELAIENAPMIAAGGAALTAVAKSKPGSAAQFVREFFKGVATIVELRAKHAKTRAEVARYEDESDSKKIVERSLAEAKAKLIERIAETVSTDFANNAEAIAKVTNGLDKMVELMESGADFRLPEAKPTEPPTPPEPKQRRSKGK